MAAFAWPDFAAHGQSRTWYPLLGRDFYHHYPSHSSVYALFHQLDLHDELYNAVWESIGHVFLFDFNSLKFFQDATCPGVWVTGVMAREIPISEHVHPIAAGTPKRRPAYRSLSRYARGRLETGVGELSR